MQTLFTVLAFIGAVSLIFAIGLIVLYFACYRPKVIRHVDVEQRRYIKKKMKLSKLKINDLLNE